LERTEEEGEEGVQQMRIAMGDLWAKILQHVRESERKKKDYRRGWQPKVN
jgi:hypothetical protein